MKTMAANPPAVPTMSANHGLSTQKKRRFTALHINIPRAKPLQPEMSYNRQLSPGGRRIANPGRTSDTLNDSSARYDRYTSPRMSVSSSAGVIPISTQTFVNYPPPSAATTSRTESRVDPYSSRSVDPYSGRPRRSSLVDAQRGATGPPSRSRPTVVQGDLGRPSSPQKSSDKYYMTPASSSKEPRKVEHKKNYTADEPRKVEHKKIYSVANDGTSNLVADVDLGSGRHHRRRDSETGDSRGAYRGGSSDKDTDRGRRGYQLHGPPKPKSIEDEDAYSYTDAAGMFRDTEPIRREPRPRRGSVDRGGASRERPVSMLDPNIDPRRSQIKDIGPPPSTRGWSKINDGVGRAASMREKARDIPQSPTRARVPQSPNRARAPTSPSRGRYADVGAYVDQRDPYYVPPRTTSEDRRSSLHPDRALYDQYDYDERREPRHHHRHNSTTNAERPIVRPDHSVERRGFGIRPDSQDRYGRGSGESFEAQNKYRDSAFEPHRRDTAPELNYQEEQRMEQEKQERMRLDRLRNEERDKPVERERRYDDDRTYPRDYERDREPRRDRDTHHDLDREREKERERMMQPPTASEPERHHHRRESNRDAGSKDSGSKSSNEPIFQPGLSSAATGGLAGAAAAFGIGKLINRNNDREKERDRETDRQTERPREQDRDRASPQPIPYRPQETHSDEGVHYTQERDRAPGQPRERGLGFAFEGAPDPPSSAPPIRDPVQAREARGDERKMDRAYEDKAPPPQVSQPGTLDPDEDYRRRMEQVQRELGRAPETDRHSDSDQDRERRRREREQRLATRERFTNGEPSVVGSAATYDSGYSSRMPGSYDNEGYEGSSARGGLARKPSILDRPLTDEPMAHIIDNSESDRRENKVRIVDPPTEEEERRPRGILKKPTEKFPEHPSAMREGVAPLKDATKSGIPPGARWTKIDRRLVNPEALEEAQERFEERLDCVIVLRVLTKEDIQKLADRTKAIRDERYEEEREERKAARRHEKHHDRKNNDEYDDDSENEFKPKAPRMLEAPAPPSLVGSSIPGTSAGDPADFGRERRGEREREHHYVASASGRGHEY